jgi:gas vesicle protein
MHLSTFIKGLSIGFIIGVLFAPDKGSATRRKISGMASDIKDDMADTFDDLSDTVSEKITNTKNTVVSITGTAKDKFYDLTMSDEERL